jgi:hypothetical protein
MNIFRFACVHLVGIAVALGCTQAAPAPALGTWMRWEHVLASDHDYTSPCADVTVRVKFAGPSGQVRDCLAFWDGGHRFLIRHTFPAPGDWTWTTSCSDEGNAGLHRQSGTIRVETIASSNPLQQRGYLRVSDDGRLLTHADGTPFLWIGDTCWAAPVHANGDEWTRYVSDRAARGYSVLQLAIAPGWALEKSQSGVAPFLSTLPDINVPNPAFFQELDRKLAQANDAGLAVLMCGLMETPYEYPPPDQIAVFSRYVAARYASFAVMYSPSFDAGIHEAETQAAAGAIRAAAPASLITTHLGTGVEPHFHGEDWLSFDLYQSGHNGGNRDRQSARAVGMPLEILALTPRRPIVNGEAIYEGGTGSAFDVRRTAWLSLLSGAVGYTGGIDEVYAWDEDAVWKMDVPSSGQVALLGRVLRTLPWWDLEPAPGRILSQPEDPERFMAFSMLTDETIGIAYLPENETISLDLRGTLPAFDLFWVSPINGKLHDGGPVVASGQTVLEAPDRRDWVAVLAAPGIPAIDVLKATLAGAGDQSPVAKASIIFRKDAPVDGLVRKSPADGAFAYTEHTGQQCIANTNPQRNTYLYLDVDDSISFRAIVPQMRVTVRLLSDASLDGIRLQYDSGGAAEVGHIYESSAPARMQVVHGWTEVSFSVGPAYLGNRQNSGADFRLFIDGRACHIASLRVDLVKSSR